MSKMREEFEQVCRDLCIEKPSRDYDLVDAVWQACIEAALSQPAAVEGWRNVVDNVANNIGEFACAMPTQDMADTLTEYANDLFGLLSAAPNPPSAPVQQSVREAFEAAIVKDAPVSIAREGSGYADSYVNAAWWGWQAALSTSPLLDKNDQTEVAVARVDMSDSANTAPRKELIFINGSLATLPVGSLLYARHQPDSNELVELRRDAERYRWIRNNAGFNLDNDYNIGNFQVSQKIKNGEAWYYYEEKLDEIIDAALAQSPSKKG
jgi:hypothetical protein